MTTDLATASFRNSAARLRRILTFSTVFLALVLVAERLGYAGAYSAAGMDAHNLLVQLTLSLPAILNLAALWSLRTAVAATARGEVFGSVVVTAFRRVGSLLAASSFAVMLVMPLLARLMGQTVQRLIDADISTLVLGTLGLGLLFVGSLIDRAGAAQRELEEFF
jgi:hypothetical protein